MTTQRTAPLTNTFAPAPPSQATQSRLLLRTCACGKHAVGGECAECKRERETQTLRRSTSPGFMQRKLTVNQPGDAYEREADRVTAAVMGGGVIGAIGMLPQPIATVHPEVAQVQREAAAAPPIVDEVLREPGVPLDLATRAFMEPRFGRDFGDVHVHTGPRAAESARAVSARAYTVGRDVVLGGGQHELGTPAGRGLLAHELAHVVQQRSPSPRVLSRKVEIGKTDTATDLETGYDTGAGLSGVIPREEWGALAPDKSKGWDEYPANKPLPLTRIVIHHTADPRDQSLKDLEKKTRRKQYADLPYHFVITEDGKVYEGRSITAVGAHAGAVEGNKDIKQDPDWGSIGIVVTGDFESRWQNLWMPDSPSASQLASLETLVNTLMHRYGIPASNVLKHSELRPEPTNCPGSILAPHVERLRAKLGRAIKPASPTMGTKSSSTMAVKATTSTGTPLSGAGWWRANQAKFPNRNTTDYLAEGFRRSVDAFLSALDHARASVKITSTLRDRRRAYLMHYSWEVAHGTINPAKVPAMTGVDIVWDHGDLTASQTAAREMVDLFRMAHVAALQSKHIAGEAIDMSITWEGTIEICDDAAGEKHSIGAPCSGASNTTLHKVGATYGVHKLITDPPHWSDNGH
jgi:hypothetical protein